MIMNDSGRAQNCKIPCHCVHELLVGFCTFLCRLALALVSQLGVVSKLGVVGSRLCISRLDFSFEFSLAGELANPGHGLGPKQGRAGPCARQRDKTSCMEG